MLYFKYFTDIPCFLFSIFVSVIIEFKMRHILLVIIVFISNFLFSQEKAYPQYPNPVKIPVYLSATFAELRSNAFHAGVDIKTQGVEGKEVFAVADGYVSRIGVSPFGYGKVLYITHNDGFTSVYAHLSKFNKVIGDFVKSRQYEKESFVQSIMLEKGQFPIKKGDFIGFTGNSGGSGGPHLHYEIRYTDTQEPVNPLYFGLKIKDTKKPVIKGLALYPMENSVVNNDNVPQYVKVLDKDAGYCVENPVFTVNGNVAFGINVYDQADGSNNKNGAYSIELFANDELIFNIVSDKYSYNETRYINSLIDYSHYIKEKERFIRTEVDEFNNLRIYEKRDGVVTINNGDTLNMKYVVKDYNGNKSLLTFVLVGVECSDLKQEGMSASSCFNVIDGQPVTIRLDNFEARIPEKAFYRDVCLETSRSDTLRNLCSDYIYQIGSEEIPLHKRMTVRIRLEESCAFDTTMYIAYVNGKGEYSFLGNTVVDGSLEVKTNVLGRYAVAKDTISPMIRPVNFRNDSSIEENWSLRVEIEDRESGIKDYAMYVNGEWVLADYDAKNKLLIYQIDSHIKEGDNELEVIVADMIGNKSVYSTTLLR